MKKIITLGFLAFAFILTGCITRVTLREMDRVDQELKGNRGMVLGKAPSLPEPEREKTRTIYDVEIELPSKFDVKKHGTGDAPKTSQGNKGYIKTMGYETLQTPQVVYQAPSQEQDKYKKEKGRGAVIAEKKVAETSYTVQKGDTLQKISNKIYGTTKKWKKIYEANKDTLKSPDLIKPGQKLVIPAE